MKKIFFTVFLCISVYSLLQAQSKQETAVANTVLRLHQAMINADKTELEDLTAEILSYGHSSGLIDNKKEFVEKIVSGRSDFVFIEMEDVLVNISGKVAVVRHKLHAKTNDNGKPGEVNLRILLVWQKLHGQWKLLARQAVKVQ